LVVPSPSPGAEQNILYGVAAISDSDVWAVGAREDSAGLWHTLTEHWNGSHWSIVSSVDPGVNGNQLYAVKAVASNDVYAVGQQAGAGFPNRALIEHWDGNAWRVTPSPIDLATVLPLGVDATTSSLTLVGQHETDTAPYTTYVAGPLYRRRLFRSGFAGITAIPGGGLWAVGVTSNPQGNYETLIEYHQ